MPLEEHISRLEYVKMTLKRLLDLSGSKKLPSFYRTIEMRGFDEQPYTFVSAPKSGSAIVTILVTHARTELPTCLMKYLDSHTMDHTRLIRRR